MFYVTVVRKDGSCTNYSGLTEDEAYDLFNRFIVTDFTQYCQYGKIFEEPLNRFCEGAEFQ